MIDALVLVLILLLTYVVVHLQRENVRLKVGLAKNEEIQALQRSAFAQQKLLPISHPYGGLSSSS